MIVFDCDGVLVDSEILSCGTDAEVMTEAGWPIATEELIATYIGWPKRAIWDDIARRRGSLWPEGLYDSAVDRMMARMATELEPVAGVAEALGRIPGPKAVASSSWMAKLTGALDHCGLTGFFDGRIFSAEQVARGKPAPDVFLFAASQSGWEPAECLVIEDSVAGVTAAKAAGMTAIGFTGGSHSYPGHAEALSAEGAVAVVAHMRDMPDAVARFRTPRSAACG